MPKTQRTVARLLTHLPLLIVGIASFLLMGIASVSSARSHVSADAAETTFTIAHVPDTQEEVTSDNNPLLPSRYQWLADHKTDLNLKFIAHSGDVVNWGVADPVQFTRASTATTILDNSGVPYGYAIGNHDGAAVKVGGSAAPGNVHDNLRNTALFNQTFPLTRLKNVEGSFEANKVDNMYQTFTAGGVDWLVLTHEMWPRQTVLDWMKQVISSHPQYNVIVVTHAFEDSTGALPTTGNYGDQNAQVEWQQVISQYSNIKMVLSGHYGPSSNQSGYGYFETTGVHGNKITEILTAYHSNTQDHVRLLKIDTANGTISSSIYVSASLNGAPTGYITDSSSNFMTQGMDWARPDAGPTPPPTATVPGTPTAVTATAGNGQATVAFTAPDSDGGSPITSYTVTSSPDNLTASGSGSPITIPGLTNGTAYSFTVKATNAVGSSQSSAASSPVILSAAGAELLADPGFETGTSGWTAFNVGTFTRVASPVRSGLKALQVASPSTSVALVGLTQSTLIANSVAGQAYTAQCYVQPTSANLNIQIRFLEYTQNFSSNIHLDGPVINSLPLNTWTLVKYTGVAVRSGERMVPQIYSTKQTTATGNIIYDDCSITTTPSTPVSAPAAPTGLTATAGDAQANVSWTAPTADGGSAITDYVIRYSVSGSGLWMTYADAVSATTSATVAGLTNGTSYDFQVSAKNNVGQSAYTGSASASPIGLASAPTAVSATAQNQQATVSFVTPISDGGSPITSYTVTSTPGNITATGTASPITITGLTNGSGYTFKVTATTAVGTGGSSVASAAVTPATTPDIPSSLQAQIDAGRVSLTWAAPASDGGSPITGYQVRYGLTGSDTWTLIDADTTRTLTVAGLTNGTSYDFQVSAKNSVGQSAYGPATTAVPAAVVPLAPTAIVAVSGDSQATVSFAAPSSDGGSPVTSYTVTSTPGGVTATGSSSPMTITGLTNGTGYSFTVTATNAIGAGTASASSNTVTPGAPATLPTAPTAVSATAKNASAVVSFTAPASGGSPVTGYTVTSTPGNITATGTASPITITGLTNGTAYTFSVKATNAAGSGPASTASAAVIPYLELLTDPGFEAGTSGWTAFNVGTLTQVNSPVHGGAKALKIAATGSAANLVGMTQNTVVSNTVLGKTYTAQCYVQPTTANLNVFIRFLEYNQSFGGSTHFDSTSMTVAKLPLNTWTQLKATAVAVKSGERMIPQIYSTNQTTATGSLIYDDCSVTAN